ncbi:hypothetical protein JDV02_003259 [Purpureocillium takamizusanense]|uniref:Uncharacterized protein n=1 Tax=Purpureocillium takamizusanense TaxID=2060973 RepID=A0A9Q8V9J9_9HYPO|nr:uncharacterized protein JDV02_003259 [Purpureocillium takamizusanense]UNI16862.1 hypothetical protein JDV02_003259 [Purpureocillium takamizusanense]
MDKSAAQDAVDSIHDDPDSNPPIMGRSTQHRRIILTALAKWLVTVTLAVSVYLVLWSYSSRIAMASDKKREFNVVMTGLSIGLGLSTASSLKAMVRELRWWLLSLRQYSSKEAELILNSEHLSCMIQLGWISRDWIVRSFVLFWLSINLAAQIAVATIGLTYNVDSSEIIAVTAPGMVFVPNLSSIGDVKPETASPEQLRYIAKTHGSYTDHSVRLGMDEYLPRPGTIESMKQPNIFSDRDSTRHTYVFYEATVYNASGRQPGETRVATNRSITFLTTCSSHKVLNDDAWNTTVTLDDGHKTRIGLPNSSGLNQTLFMTDSEQPDLTTRWSIINVLEASSTDSWHYRCNVSAEHVTNAVLVEHEVSDFVATVASAAIALQGFGAALNAANCSRSRDQFQSYPFKSYYGGPQQGNGAALAWRMSLFAAGFIASVAESNYLQMVPGLAPLDTVVLKLFDWGYVHLNLGLIVGLQLLLAAGTLGVVTRHCHPPPQILDTADNQRSTQTNSWSYIDM